MVKVAVANDAQLFTKFHTTDTQYNIQGQDLRFDFKVLPLHGYDMILGTDRIKHHSPVLLDYKKMCMQITGKENKVLTFWDESLPTTVTMQETANINLMMEQQTCGVAVFVAQVDSSRTRRTPKVCQNIFRLSWINSLRFSLNQLVCLQKETVNML